MSDICVTTSGCSADYLRRVKVQKSQHSPAARGVIHIAKAPRGCISGRRLTQQLQCGIPCKEDVEVDVAIVGAGVIGLCTAYSLLRSTNLSVALIEANRQVPATTPHCGAATGAGQGYIWLAHRDPSSIAWQLAAESQSLWQELLQRPHLGAGDVEWQSSGSLLLARESVEAKQLQARQERLRRAGIAAQYLDEGALHAEEPALHSSMAGGLLVSSDSQLNGRAAAKALLAACQSLHAGASAFRTLLGHPVVDMATDGSSGAIQSIATREHRIWPREGVVIATGAWTPHLARMISSAQAPGLADSDIQPRKGHLLELPASLAPAIKHGLMEIGYAKHYQRSEASAEGTDITFTATQSASGSLLLGSSRELCGFDGKPDHAVIQAILERARSFLPALHHVSAADVDVRIGLRPYSRRGMPHVGRLPGCPNAFVAAGHEGSGLTLGPATGELMCRLVAAAEEVLPAYAAALQLEIQ